MSDVSYGRIINPSNKRAALSILLALLLAVIAGLFGAYCYYSESWRPLAHTVQIWVLLVAIVTHRQRLLVGAALGSLTLVVSVCTYFLRQSAIYTGKYGSGAEPILDVHNILLWSLMGLVGGLALGAVGSYIGHSGLPEYAHRIAIISSAVFVSLLAVDGWWRYKNYSEVLPLIFGVFGIVVVLMLGKFKSWWAILLVAVPLCTVAIGLIAATGYLGRL